MELALGILGMGTVIYITSMSFVYDHHEKTIEKHKNFKGDQFKY